ncbi:MAG: hypothetical protein ACYC92_10320 [Candidatus Acidiferrales bacterium]
MKRSGDVTASAIILFFGSAIAVLMALLMLLAFKATPLPPEQRAVEWTMPIVYALVAAWGIPTGVGILQLRPWARTSIIVMSGMAIVFTVCGALGMMALPLLFQQEPGVPSAAIKVVMFVGLIIMAVPLAIAIWWVILFTRRRVRLEFATRGAGVVSSAIPGAAPALDPAPGFAPAFAAAPSTPQIPISIRVIAIFILVTAPFALLSLPLAVRTHVPTIVLGVLVTGWGTPAYLVASVVIQIALAAALLLKRFRAVDGMIVYLLFALLNALLFFVSPVRNVFLDSLIRVQSSTPGIDPEMLRRFINTLMPVIMGVSALSFAIALYFLFTRRRAYRAACEARREVA